VVQASLFTEDDLLVEGSCCMILQHKLAEVVHALCHNFLSLSAIFRYTFQITSAASALKIFVELG